MAARLSTAVAASRPSCSRWLRATVVIRRDCLRPLSRKTGKTASAISASRQSRTSMTTLSATRVTTLPTSGKKAVTATSCRRPTSPVSRVTRSPVRLRSWKASDSRCT